MNINDVYTLQCIDLNHDGLGVVKIDNFPIFVNDLLVGENAKIKITKINNNYALGEVVTRLTNSSVRVKPVCPYYGICGGCDLMHMAYDSELIFKLKMVNETLKRIGHIDYQIKEIKGATNPNNYRNKVQFPYQFNGKKNVCGYYQKKSHDLVEIEECIISPDESVEIARFIRNLFNEYKLRSYDETKGVGILRNVLIRKNYLNEYMVTLICNELSFDHLDDIVNKIKNRYSYVKSIILNYNHKKNNTILGDEFKVLYGNDYLIEDICGLKFKMSHKAFFQINHEQTIVLYNKVLEFLGDIKDKRIVDLYCGVGTISLLLARFAKKVLGVEVVEEAIDNAKDNKLLNSSELNAKDIDFICGKAEDVINKVIDDYDAIVVDPPRKGLDGKVVQAIIQSKIKKVVYVSCDCATLARDLNLLSKYYDIIDGCCVDLFPRTSHVETVCLLTKNSPK